MYICILKTATIKLLLVIILVSFSIKGFHGQNLSGFIYDETNAGVPFVNVYIKNIGMGTTTDAEGKYFLRFTDPGMYEIVFSSIGYETQETTIIFESNEDKTKNIWLVTDQNELDELLVQSKRKDPAYGIIANAIDQKERWEKQFDRSTSDVYIKAKEVLSEKEQKRRQKEADQTIQEAENSLEEDVFELEQKKKNAETMKIAGSMNMAEIHMKRHFQLPNDIKEIREGYKKLGNTRALFYLNTSEADFNFYDNLMSLNKLNELPVVSPLHFSSILTYKFKLEETTLLGERMLYKIKVTPRKSGNATWEGYIWILDKSFNIQRLELSLDKGGLLIYQDFTIKQEYEFIEDSIIVLRRQEFDYSSKGGRTVFTGNTIAKYSNYIINPTFPKRFFKNEVAITTQEAYDKDTNYWTQIRPEPLTIEEQQYQRIKDSIYAYQTSDTYLDSVDSVFNRVTVMDVLWDGIEFSNRQKKQYTRFSSVASLFDPFEIGGLRVGPDFSYFKKWENEKYIYINPGVDIGIRNQDIKYDLGIGGRYDPMHAGYLRIWTGKLFNTIVENDALTNLFSRSNWIEEERFNFVTSRELFNGFYAYMSYQYVNRFPIDQYQFNPEGDDWFGGNAPLTFENYQSSILALTFEYTPFQKYMTEPHRKVVLGSRWPTFRGVIERGVPSLFGSDIDFTFLQGTISQSLKVGTLGTTSYKAIAGKFINKNDLRYVDQKIFPRGDKWFFASLMESMQIQDTTLTVSDFYYQLHVKHNFNGAIVNYIPLVKKLGIQAVVGASTLYIQESKYRYGEVYLGLEKTFKVQRSRIRLGVYFVEAKSNFSDITPRIKFAVNRYSLRDQSWGY